jgi:patatin-like phospholipase/acyl hydrolase
MLEFKLLSCAGGGFFGYGEILVLIALEKQAGVPAYKLFDGMGGTSAGAINTAPLSIGVPAATVAEFYTEWGPKIFKRDLLNIAEDLKLVPKYGNEVLTEALQSLLEITEEDGSKRQATLRDCKTRWLATRLNMCGMPEIICSWLPTQVTPFGKIIGYDSPLELWQLVLCSAAAPTYFPGVQLGTEVFIDGGLTGANSPDATMLMFMESEAGDRQMKMLSLGSGDSKWDIRPDGMVKPSDLHAAMVILKTFLAAGVDLSNLQASVKLGNYYFHLSASYDPTFEMDDTDTGLVKIPEAVSALLATSQATLDEFATVA